MKSYLSLIPISAKVRKRQNRMTVLCIIISVFLVTAIFSVADMMIRTESANYAQTECQFRYCGTAIPFLTVRSTAR